MTKTIRAYQLKVWFRKNFWDMANSFLAGVVFGGIIIFLILK